ncbi:MAG: hypothetical protein M1305_06670 [Candidatus Marsarchaeota archaeon]|jgi:RNase P subunit p30.|nr:hypothetical protein [Candidatus Marsarchaeota archaeon]MCL5420116.1 hypothetical protein [Candidatus Marsarchaeota archaeon]
MGYFDAVRIGEGVDQELASRLGFTRIITLGSELPVLDRPSECGRKYLLKSGDTGILMKGIRDVRAAGIMLSDNEIIGKAIAAAKENGKPIVVDLFPIFSKASQQRFRNIARIRGLISAVLKARADIAVISGAESPDYLMSRMQMAELSVFLGISREAAPASLGRIGEMIDH